METHRAPCILLVGLLSLAGSVLLAACKTTEPVPAVPPVVSEGQFFVAGYHPWWMGEAWTTYDAATLDALLFFSVDLADDGTLQERHGWPDVWFRMIEQSRAHGTCVAPVVTLFDEQAFVRLFSSEHARQTLLGTLTDLLRDATTICGLQLDFEIYQRVPEEVRAAVTAFVQDLREAMQQVRPGLTLSMFMPAFDRADVFDEAALSRSVDYFVVQGYDLHARRGDVAGPVAPLDGWQGANWNAIVSRYLELGVPPKKLVLSVPYYGYEWPTESEQPRSRTRGSGQLILSTPVDTTYLRAGHAVGSRRARQHGLRRDAQSRAPYYAYQDSTGWYQGWFEDAESLQAKYDFVRQRGLGGVAVFALGYGDAAFADVLRHAFGPASP